MRKHFLGFVAFISLVLSLIVGLPAAQGAESEQPVGAAADTSPRGGEPIYVPGEVLVTFDGEATRQQKRSVRAQAAGGRLTARSSTPDRVGPNVELMPLGKGIGVTEAIADLEDKPGVVAVEPNYILHTTAMPNDPYVTDGSLWGMYGAETTPSNAYGSNAAAAWDAGYTGSDKVYVAVIDEVVDVDHPDLAGNMWSNAAEVNGTTGVDDDGNGVVDDVHGYDVVAGGGIIDSTNAGDHGTHVAGTIGAVGGNGIGVSGVSPDVSLISVGAFRNLSGTTADVITALDYVTKLRTKLGIDIVATNNSWGGPGSRALLDAIKRGGDAGILFIAAAGNDGLDNDNEIASVNSRYPSAYDCSTAIRSWDCVISVAAIDSSGALATFSNRGDGTVDIGAPGVGIWSTNPTSSGSDYSLKSGTSMATPHVSGAIALCAAANRGLSEGDLRQILLDTAAPTASLAGLTATGGRLDVGAMLTQCAQGVQSFAGGPSSLVATAYYTDRIRLQWTDNSAGEYEQEIQVAIGPQGCAGTFQHLAFIGPGLTSYPVVGLAEATFHCFRIRSLNDQAQSSWVVSNMEITWTSNLPFIHGRVLMADGTTPVSGMSVRWLPEGLAFNQAGSNSVIVSTNEYGEYALQASPGEGVLYMQTPTSQGAGSPTPLVPVGFKAGGRMTLPDADTAVNLTLPPLREITVVVKDADTQQPIPGVRITEGVDNSVTCETAYWWNSKTYRAFPGALEPTSIGGGGCEIWSSSLRSTNPAMTDAQGTVTLAVVDDALIARDYILIGAHPTQPQRTSSVTFRATAANATVTMSMAPLVTLSGTVVMADGTTPVSGMSVLWLPEGLAFDAAGTNAVKTTSNSSGAYSLEVSPGEGVLYVQTPTAQGGSSPTPPLPIGMKAGGRMTLVTSGASVTLTMPPVREITVQVEDADTGLPMPGVRITEGMDNSVTCETAYWWNSKTYRIFPGALEPASIGGGGCEIWRTALTSASPAITDANGAVSLIVIDDALIARDYILVATHPTVPSRTTSATFRATAANSTVTMQMSSQVTLSGTVVLADGSTPVSGASVRWLPDGLAYDQAGTNAVVVSTDSAGAYSLQASPGAGVLYVQTPTSQGLASPTPLLPVGLKVGGGMTLGPAGGSVTVTLPPIRDITVRVEDAYSGDPIEGAFITEGVDNSVTCESAYWWNDKTYRAFHGASEPSAIGGGGCEIWSSSLRSTNPALTDADGEVTLPVIDDELFQRDYILIASHPIDPNRTKSVSFRATAANATQTMILPGTPSRPERPSATPTTTEVTLTWEEPWDGGAQIDYYRVSLSLEPNANYQPVSSGTCAGNIDSTWRSCTVTGLTPGTTYYFAIVAHNVVGAGALATLSSTTAPGAPPSLAASASGSSVQVTWSAPNQSGTAIIEYQVNIKSGATTIATRTVTSSPVTFADVSEGTYSVEVRARSGSGWGRTAVTSVTVDPVEPTPTPSSTPTPSATATPTPSATPTASATPTPTASPTPSATATAPPTGGGGGGGGAPEPTPTGPSPTNPAPTPSPTGSPVPTGPVPIAERPEPGTAQGLVGGKPDPNLAVVPDSSGQRVSITGTGFELALAGSDGQGRPQPLGDSGALRVPSSGSLQLQGGGFTEDDVVQVFLDPAVSQTGLAARILADLIRPTTYLGAVSTDSEGRIESDVALPPGLEPGDRVLQLIGRTSAGDDVVLTVGITVEPGTAASIVITGTRGEGRDVGRIYVRGTTRGLADSAVAPWIKVSGQTSYRPGTARPVVGEDGTFTWRRSSGKKTYVYFTSESGVRSKAIAIAARPRR